MRNMPASTLRVSYCALPWRMALSVRWAPTSAGGLVNPSRPMATCPYIHKQHRAHTLRVHTSSSLGEMRLSPLLSIASNALLKLSARHVHHRIVLVTRINRKNNRRSCSATCSCPRSLPSPQVQHAKQQRFEQNETSALQSSEASRT